MESIFFWIYRIVLLHLGCSTTRLPLSLSFSLKNALRHRVSTASAIELIRNIGWLTERGKPILQRKTCPRPTLFTTNPTQTGLLSNPELCNEKPATNRLHLDPVLCLEQCIFLEITFTPLSVLRSSPLPKIMTFSWTLTLFLKHLLTFLHKVMSTSPLSFLQIIFMHKPKCHYARLLCCVVSWVINFEFIIRPQSLLSCSLCTRSQHLHFVTDIHMNTGAVDSKLTPRRRNILVNLVFFLSLCKHRLWNEQIFCKRFCQMCKRIYRFWIRQRE